MTFYTLKEEAEIARGVLKGLYHYGDHGEATHRILERLRTLEELQKRSKSVKLICNL